MYVSQQVDIRSLLNILTCLPIYSVVHQLEKVFLEWISCVFAKLSIHIDVGC